MDFQSIQRTANAFQQPVSDDHIVAMCRRAFGAETTVVSAVELSGGMYNTAYRIQFDSAPAVILRVAPEPNRQFRIERALMRNEHASLPYFAPIATMMPRTLFVDWTREIIDRDYVFQSALNGVPGPEALVSYPRSLWKTMYRQLGVITKSIHQVWGERFGPVAGPTFATWSEAVLAFFADAVADMDDAGLDASDVRMVSAVIDRNREILDEIRQPYLLHGDLWTQNLMLAPDTPEPTIIGVLDHDRASWGDPASDWPILMVRRRPGTERDAFWESYGSPQCTPNARWRSLIYRAKRIAEIRLEQHRLGHDTQPADRYEDMCDVLDQLRS